MNDREKAGAATAVASGILLSRIAGLIRDRVFAFYLGNSPAAGAFKAALRIPNFLQNLFGEGVLSASFIPVYAKLRAEGRDEEAVRLAGTVGSLLGALVTLIAAIGVLSAETFIDVLAPGFKGEVRELTISLVRIMFPGVALLVLSAWCLGILNSHRKFLLSYTAPVLWNLAIIAALLLFGGTGAGQADLSKLVAWATVIGAALQLGVQLPTAFRLARGMQFSLSTANAHTRTVLKNFFPVVTSRGVVQISAYIDGVIASFLGAPMVAAMAYAQMIYLLPVSLFGMSISAAELPSMSAITGDRAEVCAALREKLITSLRRISYFVIPSVVALAVLGDVIAATAFQTGQFRHEDAVVVWIILMGSAVGLLATTQGRLCSTAFYALQDTKTPLRFACIRVLITGIAGYVLAVPVREALGWSEVTGAAALTASAGVAGWIEFMLLRSALSRTLGSFSVGVKLLAQLWMIAIISGIIAVVIKLSLPALYPALGGGIILASYGVIFVALTMFLNIGEGANFRKRYL